MSAIECPHGCPNCTVCADSKVARELSTLRAELERKTKALRQWKCFACDEGRYVVAQPGDGPRKLLEGSCQRCGGTGLDPIARRALEQGDQKPVDDTVECSECSGPIARCEAVGPAGTRCLKPRSTRHSYHRSNSEGWPAAPTKGPTT